MSYLPHMHSIEFKIHVPLGKETDKQEKLFAALRDGKPVKLMGKKFGLVGDYRILITQNGANHTFTLLEIEQ